ncbi:uncharacterized protein I303_100189 [Kwoniella dejecticola CBS 10117]|uniref:Uncharacterized protein n=1 Tax=Kwoniella dejecticola CBS 10117 TaxID=1296121 RepID=A0A1A6AE73_9TREE|nr:uncharacterized protein I303_00191 [Kwoniella dejecticola CBS 10117]OBR88376.1 hypothetical protein I303_00191 [Kwoniella dejecticola CBS 10117]
MSPVLTPAEFAQLDSKIDLTPLKSDTVVADKGSMAPPDFITFPKQRSTPFSAEAQAAPSTLPAQSEPSIEATPAILPPSSLATGSQAFLPVVGPSRSALFNLPPAASRTDDWIYDNTPDKFKDGSTWQDRISFKGIKRHSEAAVEEDLMYYGKAKPASPTPPLVPIEGRTRKSAPTEEQEQVIRRVKGLPKRLKFRGPESTSSDPASSSDPTVPQEVPVLLNPESTIPPELLFQLVSETPLFDPAVFPCTDEDLPDIFVKNLGAVPFADYAPWKGGDDRWHLEYTSWQNSFDYSVLGDLADLLAPPPGTFFPADTVSP